MPRTTRPVFAALALLGALACSKSSSSPGADGGACTTALDCLQGQECTNGQCVVPACGGMCNATNQVCIAGSCRAANGVDCTGDAARCPSDYTCTNNTCLEKCLMDSDCPTGFSCDVDTFVCTQCSFNTDCSAPTPICDTTSGICVGCMQTTDCQPQNQPNGMICNTQTQTCVLGCNSVADCPVGTTTCQGVTATTPGLCIQCMQNTDCLSSTDAVCNTTTNLCVQCLMDSDCTGVSTRCLVSTNTCVACTHDLDCGDGMICSQTTNICEAGCTGGYGDAMCPDATPVCQTSTSTPNGTCVQCESNSQCSYMQTCATGTSTCVPGCQTDAQCIPPAGATTAQKAATICDPGKANGAGQCVDCRMDSDCTNPAMPICDSTLEICRCLGIGDGCSMTSQCGYSPDLGPPTYGCDMASRTANSVMCVTTINCNQDPSNIEQVSAQQCVMAGMDQGIPDQCPNGSGSPGDPMGCPNGYVVELASDGTMNATGVQYTAVCVPQALACTNTCF